MAPPTVGSQKSMPIHPNLVTCSRSRLMLVERTHPGGARQVRGRLSALGTVQRPLGGDLWPGGIGDNLWVHDL